MTTLLQPLRDIAGVDGAFIVGRDGRVYERDLAAFIPDDVLSSVADRACRLFDAVEDGAEAASEVLLQFATSTLVLRRIDDGFVGVLAHAPFNLEAVRIAVNLLRRRMGRSAGSLSSALPASAMKIVGFTPPPVPSLQTGTPSVSSALAPPLTGSSATAAPAGARPNAPSSAASPLAPRPSAPKPAAPPLPKKKSKIWG